MSNIVSRVTANWRRVALGVIAVAGIVGLSAGSAVAAAQITSSDIRNQTIQSQDIGRDEVGSSELRPKAVKTGHINNGAIGWNDIRPGTIGPGRLQDRLLERIDAGGGQGEPGEDGADGEDGVSGYEIVGPEETWTPGAHTLVAQCPGGKVATSGGYSIEGRNRAGIDVRASAPSGLTQVEDGTWQATGWKVRGVNTSDGNATMQAFVTCAAVN